jgi:Fe-S cluster assembly ATPase SufC
MKKTILSAALTASFFMISCGSKTLAEVKPGMTEAEVKEMMGDPNGTNTSSNSSSINGEENSSSSSAEWVYNGKGRVFFEDGKVTKVHPNDADE